MSLRERTYSVLVVSAVEKLNTALSEMLCASHYDPVRFVSNVAAARRAFSEQAYDLILVSAPLPDDTGTRFAIDASATRGSVVLLLVRADVYEGLVDRVTEHGVFVLSKPVSRQLLATALGFMESARERLRRQEAKELSFEEKMEEIRIVNRAKWLLIGELGMDEPAAHRYIEKQAMDRCISKREAAEEIIRTYRSS